MPVYFHSEDIEFSFNTDDETFQWVEKVIAIKEFVLSELNVIFTSNAYLRKLNQEYLNHNYNTDVITFDYCEGKMISGDIFISIDQVRINSDELNTDFQDELLRVIIHGVLHLLGFKDSTEEEKAAMRREEDAALRLIKL